MLLWGVSGCWCSVVRRVACHLYGGHGTFRWEQPDCFECPVTENITHWPLQVDAVKQHQMHCLL